MGRVALSVADLERSIAYYRRSIGLIVRQQDNATAVLGTPERDLLVLQEQPGARPTRGTTGLYHYALLTPSRLELARTLRNLIATDTPMSGFSDHLVSEAIYLQDPDDHGIEIYRDRSRSEWAYSGGKVRMAVDPLDIHGLLAEVEADDDDWNGISPGTVMGHVHLHVAGIAEAERFYSQILGLEIMARYGAAASFVAAGGYHHHLGLNTWAGVNAPPPPPDTARLLWYEMRLPDESALTAVRERLQAAGCEASVEGESWRTIDPSRNVILLTHN
jgi:catechol 2,3-dioxygenase